MESRAHEHCESCFKQHCNANSVCKTVPCEFGCSALMHSCKMADHKIVCQKIKVPCINVGYGCPTLIPREKIKCHLEVCPASVTCCTMEWNRYPIYSKSRLSWVPFFQPNPILVKGQLDVELTLRDQRVLQDLIRQRMKRGKTKVDKLRTTAAFRKEVKQMVKSTECEDRAISMALALSTLEERIRVSKRNNQVIGNDLLTDCIVNNYTSISDEDELEEGAENPHNISNRKTFLENLLVDNENASELPCLGSIKESNQGIGQSLKRSGGINSHIPVPPELAPGSFDQNLGLNIMIETLPKFQKQFPMYSIPCNQVLRRNEFGSHFKNVHSDIQGGLNGWMEHRCPLAHYGCTFVRYRILPHSQNGVVVFDQDLGSFGIKLDNKQDFNQFFSNSFEQPLPLEMSETTQCRELAGKDMLSTLPEEVLEHIASMLDGFSLCSFSRTCKVLREAARHVLETKGMVVLQWEKKIYRTGHWRWRVRQKKWFFSTSFTEVEKWVHSNTPCMAAHLQECKYFDHYRAQEKFRYVPTKIEKDLDVNKTS